MPRENRKRGKRHKKHEQEERTNASQSAKHQKVTEERARPSWIIERNDQGEEHVGQQDAPFGYVDPNVKAYFKTVDAKLREWQELGYVVGMEEGDDANLNEERRLFMVAALQELSGKEKQLATDPECSNTLERMAYSMDDFVKRVFVDRLADSYETLARDRFGSHVVQTLLSVAKGTISREARGIVPPSPSDEEKGCLPLLTELIIDISNELLPSTTSLIMDSFASHVLRALFLVLCPTLSSASEAASILRSRKSAKHRSKQGPMKSVLMDAAERDDLVDEKGKCKAVLAYPTEFDAVAQQFVNVVRDTLSANEIRALATDKVACPVLVLLIEMESIYGMSNEVGSLMDSVSAGLVSTLLHNPKAKLESSDYVTTLLRDTSSSHLLERLVSLAPGPVFDVMWELYFAGKLSRLAVHPVANFVVARAFERATSNQIATVEEELRGIWPKFVGNSRTGILKALVDRTVQLKDHQEDVVQVIFDAFGLHSPEERKSVVECILYLKSYGDLRKTQIQKQAIEDASVPDWTPEPTVQGSVLLQSLLQLDAPHNQMIVQSLIRQPTARLLAIAHHPTSSRVLDALLSSPTVPSSARRQLILAFQGHFPALVDDRIGSRVGERLWAAADPYLKEKFARGLIPHETALVGSRYGKYFVRGLNLYLLKRDPEKWKTQQLQNSGTGSAKKEHKEEKQTKPKGEPKQPPKEKDGEIRKRKKEEPQDEIDELFESTLGKRQKRGSLMHEAEQKKTSKVSSDKELSTVFNAIRNAPKQLEPSGKKKKKR